MIDLNKDGYYFIPANPDGAAQMIFTDATDEPTLPFMQKSVGGYIEVIYLGADENQAHMVLNEEGKLEGLDPNLFATRIARANGLSRDDYIAGDVLVLCGKARMT